MGQADLFAKQTFAEETERLTRGAITWLDPPEIGLVKLLKVQGDGLLQVRRPDLLADMVAPWSHARSHAQVLIEMKMEGDHLGVPSVQRAILRRQALWVQRVEERGPPWPIEEPLWLTAPHVPTWLKRARKLVPVGPGCYAVEPTWIPFLWIAANELPLCDELVPFLVARSGKALEDFARWAAPRRPLEWMVSMIQSTAMPNKAYMKLLSQKPESPAAQKRRRAMLDLFLANDPERAKKLTKDAMEKGIKEGIEKGREQGIEQGRLLEARAALRRVLARRQLALTARQAARIETCADSATLERWLEQAITAATTAEALK